MTGTKFFCALSERPDRTRVCTNFIVWDDDAKLHR